MKKLMTRYGKLIMDFCYSIVAYALPTVTLQLVIQPVIASVLSKEANGLFLTVLSAIRLGVNVFITALANLRLLEKAKCKEEAGKEKEFNLLFSAALLFSSLLTIGFSVYYMGSVEPVALLLTLIVSLLICTHDYYSIHFRVEIRYKKIVLDNLFIVVGYFLGLLVFFKTHRWEYVFIGGYLLGTIYVFVSSDMWKKGAGKRCEKRLIVRYAELGASSALNNSITYCDKLLMYPVLGGESVSTYNAASVVSKVVSLISVPVRNVLLSYMVDKKEIVINRKKAGLLLGLIGGGFAAIFLLFSGASFVLCSLLYPTYYDAAKIYILLIVAAVVCETFANLGNIVLLQFADAKLQTIISGVKLGTYAAAIFLLQYVFSLELYGFCIAGFLAAFVKMAFVAVKMTKHIRLTDKTGKAEA